MISTLLQSLLIFGASQDCIPARKYVPVGGENERLGAYMRFHPSGRYLLASVGAGVLYDLESSPVRRIQTPTIDEVYPVEGSWKLLASPNHGNGMRYYSLQKILDAAPTNSRNVPEEFSDREHNEYYHSSAEFADSTPNNMHFRTVLFERLKYRDYRVSWSSTGEAQVEKGPIQRICRQVLAPETAATFTPEQIQVMEARLATLENERLKFAEELMVIEKAARGSPQVEKYFSAKSQELATQISGRENEIVELMRKLNRFPSPRGEVSTPILSKDGNHVAAQMNGITAVLKIEGETCRIVGQHRFASSKASFAYPDSDQQLVVAMYTQGAMHVWDVKKNLIWKVSSADDDRSGTLRYPGFLKDGRLAYYTCKRDERTCGVMFIDPYQVPGAPQKDCITRAAVAATARSFQSTR